MNRTGARKIGRCISPKVFRQRRSVLSNPAVSGLRRRRSRENFQKPREPIPFVRDVKNTADADEAILLFHEQERLGFKHDYPSYSSLLYKLARCRSFHAVEAVLDYMKGNGVPCREKLFVVLIQHYGKVGLPEKATELFHDIPNFNSSRTSFSLNYLLNVLVDNDLLLDAISLLRGSSKMGIRPNAVSFNITIKGYLRKGEFEQARHVFDEMPDSGIHPTVVTYNCLIGHLCRKGDMKGSKILVEAMKKEGRRPNAITYAQLMEGLCCLDRYRDAEKMMFDMDYEGCNPEAVNYGVLMTYLGKKGRIEEAISLLVKMKKKKQSNPNVVVYNILINYMCKEGRSSEAYKLLDEMQVQGVQPNAATYRMMVDGFLNCKDYSCSLTVLNAMLLSGHCPRIHSFSQLAVGLLEGGALEGAYFVLDEMLKREMYLDKQYWETLILKNIPLTHISRCIEKLLLEAY